MKTIITTIVLCSLLSACNPVRRFSGGTINLHSNEMSPFERRTYIKNTISGYGQFLNISCNTNPKNSWLLVQCKDKETIFNVIDSEAEGQYIVTFGQRGSWVKSNRKFCTSFAQFKDHMALSFGQNYIQKKSFNKCASETTF